MGTFNTEYYRDYFVKELKDNLLSFWLPRCLNEQYGGYVNCFTNDGSRLVSKDKYTWSQGRFLWMFSKLASTESAIFTDAERQQLLALAKSGRDFLLSHALIAEDDYRCVFLMEEDGTPKYVDGCTELDMSIYADCFVVLGFAKYAEVTKDTESYDFAITLFESIWKRFRSGNYKTLPYPVSDRYCSHGLPMILTNTICELYRAAEHLAPNDLPLLKERLNHCHHEVFEIFADDDHLVHEFRLVGGDFPPNLFGQHINPGHTLEDMWFQLEAADILGGSPYEEKIGRIAKKTFDTGWDETFGGIYHFVTCDGKGMQGDVGDAKDEPQMKLVLGDWGSKLWWVHSETLYVTLLMFDRTNDQEYLDEFIKAFEYTMSTFPNPDTSIGEWIQIRTREGAPQDKVVALPVKDPYHIIRNVILIIELLEKRLSREKNV